MMAGLWWLPRTQRGLCLASWQAGIDEFADRGCGLVPAKAQFAAQEAPGGKVGDRGELGQLPAAGGRGQRGQGWPVGPGDPVAVITAAAVGDGPDRRHPGLLGQQVCLLIAPALVVGGEVREVSGRGGLAIGADLAGTLLRSGGEQVLLGAESAQHGLDGHSGALGDDRKGHLVVGPLGEQGAGGSDDGLGGGLGGLGPGPHAVGPLPQPLTSARLHVSKVNIKVFMLAVDALRSSADIDRFFAERRARWHSSAVSANALVALLGFLRDRQVIGARPAADAGTPAGRLLADYRRYLREERDWTASAPAAAAASPAQVSSAVADGARAWWQFLDERQTAA